jgi:hypothetical protein
MGCGNSKTKDEEVEKNENKDNMNNENNEINNNEEEIRNEKKIKIIKKIEEENESKVNGEPTKTSIKELENKRNYEDYEEDNEICEEIEEDEIIDEKEMKEIEINERRKYLDNLRFEDIFKEDNINKHNTSIFDDRKKKVRTIFIPSQKGFAKVDKYFDPIQGVNGPFFEVNVKASKNEIMYPLWIEKNKEVIFYINGKWKINNEIECDCKGIKEIENKYEKYMNNVIKNKFNKGALIGRVINGDYFEIYDGLRYISDKNGPLILRMNLNSLGIKEKPSGSLNLKIKGVININTISDMEDRIGWWKQLKIIELNNLKDIPNYKIPSIEKMIIIIFNKARYNSKLFSNQYLYNIKNLTPNSNKIYNQFQNNLNQNVPFKINVSIIKLLQNFFKPFLSGDNSDSLIIIKSKTIIKNYLYKCFNGKKNIYHISILKYRDKNPFYLASRLLFEDEIRENIFKSDCKEMSMITIQTNQSFKKYIFYTIVVLSNEKGNDNIKYDIDPRSFIKEDQKINGGINIISTNKINLNPLPNIFSSSFQFN